MIVELHFDKGTHTYRKNGAVIPSVTQCLEAGGLRDYSGIPDEVLRNKAELGELVHRATELDAFGVLNEATVDEQVWPYLKAWRKFRDETGAAVISAEQKVYHTLYGYAGTLDHIVVINGEYGVLDKKTGLPDPSDGVQLAAYQEAVNHGKRLLGDRRAMKRWGLYLANTGKYQLVPYDNAGDFAVFLAALTIKKWRMSIHE
jgi:hypothetical protein